MHVLQIMMNAEFGGAERAFLDTCLSLAEQGVRVSAVVNPRFVRKADLQAHDGISVIDLPAVARWDPLAKLRLRRIVRDVRPDLAHIHLRKGMALAQWALTTQNVPIVASMHNYGRIDRYARADRLLALSQGHADYLSSSGRDVSTIDIVPNFSRFPAASRAKPIPQRSLKLLSYGRFVHKKGFDVLIKAFAEAATVHDDLSLTIAGRGGEEPALRQLVDSLDLAGRCTIQGWADDPVALLDAHDVFVLPSRSEPFGIVVLEAMARARPVISTDTEGPAQYLRSDFAVCCKRDDVASLANAITQACADRGRLARLGESALQEFQHKYTPHAVVPHIVESYRKALADRAAPLVVDSFDDLVRESD